MGTIEILNTIYENASTMYQEAVPLATLANLAEVGNPIINIEAVRNEFLNTLINKIGMTVVRAKVYANPLATLKKGGVPLGSDIEELFTNMAKAREFPDTENNLLTKHKPDTKVMYHRMNRSNQYAVTVTKERLQTAFTSFNSLEQFITSVINSLYSGNARDEFNLAKDVFVSAYNQGMIKTIGVENPIDEATGKAFIKELQITSSLLKFPTSAFNKYKEYFDTVHATDVPPITTEAVETFTENEDKILLIRSDVLANINVDVLATAFNMDKVAFKENMLEVDTFADTDILAILCDKACPQIYDNLFEMSSFYNAKDLEYTYYLTVRQTYSFSMFANCVVFTGDGVTPSENKVAFLSPDGSYVSVEDYEGTNIIGNTVYIIDGNRDHKFINDYDNDYYLKNELAETIGTVTNNSSSSINIGNSKALYLQNVND